MGNNDNLIIDIDNDESESLKTKTSSSHSHHHSHHHHSHHSSRKRKNRKAEEAKRFLKRNKYKLSNVLVAVVFIVILLVVALSMDIQKDFSGEKNVIATSSNKFQITDSAILIEIPVFDEDVVIVGPAVKAYAEAEATVQAADVYDDYFALGRLDTGLPVTLSYNVKGLPEGYSVRSAEVFVSENDDFDDPIVYYLANDETSVDVYNLKTGTQYYYRISLSLSNGTKTSVEGSFKTAKTPRVLSVDGVYNLRDIGGWKTLGGKTVKQGLLYRSTEIDGAVESGYAITPAGVSTMLNDLRIRTDMDLRSSSENKNGTDALGTSVKHVYYNVQMYSGAFKEEGKAAIRKVFSDLSDKNNYPILLHCTHGMDRTGTVCYLLEALLGVSEEDLMRDYQLSALYHGNLWGLNQMNEFIGQLKSYEGVTIQDKAESYLLSIGVSVGEIASIREIFLVD